VSRHKPDNLWISILDSKAYESPAGLPSATTKDTDLEKIAGASGIKKTLTVSSERIHQDWSSFP
jgi:hypothetical protein